MSQEALAGRLGVTFQQVQKYERGYNRVSASTLWEIARALKTTVSYFYEGLNEAEPATEPLSSDAELFVLTPEGQELAALFPKLARQAVRRKVLELVRVLREEG